MICFILFHTWGNDVLQKVPHVQEQAPGRPFVPGMPLLRPGAPPPPPRKGFFPLEGRSQAVLCYQLLCAPTGTPSSLGPWCSFLFFLLAISGWISDVSKTHRASRDF